MEWNALVPEAQNNGAEFAIANTSCETASRMAQLEAIVIDSG